MSIASPSTLRQKTRARLRRLPFLRVLARWVRARSRRRHVVFLAGEPHTPGRYYRVERFAEAARRSGFATTVLNAGEARTRLDAFLSADLAFIWRCWWDEDVEEAVAAARAAGAAVVFDIDDLLFEPELARHDEIDGLRSQGAAEAEMRVFFAGFGRTLAAADYCTAPTAPLLERMKARSGRPGFILPNGFDHAKLARSRSALRARRAEPADGLLRIGYAAGTRTHQRDFAEAAEAVARVLAEGANRRLVLFKSGELPQVMLEEFPALASHAHQIEWREMRPLHELPEELARFDINIAPLQRDNLFCEAKSELKYFEAALVETPTVASPTQPYRAAIQDEQTGFLAADPEAWYAALSRLAADGRLRTRIGRAAYRDCRRRFGPAACRRSFSGFAAEILRGRPAQALRQRQAR